MTIISLIAIIMMSISTLAAITPVNGTSITFDKFLVLPESTAVPDASFTYAITAGETAEYSVGNGAKTVRITAGPSPSSIEMDGVGTGASDNEIKIAAGESTTNYAGKPPTDLIKNFVPGQKYVKKTATLDFSGVTFTAAGIYRYIITETGGNEGITDDMDSTRAIDVYVAYIPDDGDGYLRIAGYVMHANESDAAVGEIYASTDPNSADATKKLGFTATIVTEDIEITLYTSGNQASKDKYFKVRVEISGAISNSEINVGLAADTSTGDANPATKDAYKNQTNATVITVDASGNADVYYYLCSGQSFRMFSLSPGTSVVITEDEEDYLAETEVNGDVVKPKTSTDTSGTITTDTVPGVTRVILTNTRNGLIPTGTVLMVFPYIMIAVIGLAGIMISGKEIYEGKDEP
jgi:hypothetical protein